LVALLSWVPTADAVSITGRITDAAGQPLAGMCIDGWGVETDADGRYRIRARHHGKRVYEFSDCTDEPVYAPGRITVFVEPGKPVTGADLVLSVGVRVKGQVRNDWDLPAGFAADAVAPRGPGPLTNYRQVDVFLVREDGFLAKAVAWSFAYVPSQPGPPWFDQLVPPGTYKVFAREYGSPSWFGDADSRAEAAEVVLTPGVDPPAMVLRSRSREGRPSIAGVVRDTAGQPIDDVVVTAAHVQVEADVRSATTNADGEYEVTGLIDGDYVVRFTAPDAIGEIYDGVTDVASATLVRVAPDAAVSGIDAVLERVPWCHGRKPTIVGTRGDDLILGSDGDDVIMALEGDDRVYAGDGHDTVCAGPGDDFVDGGHRRDVHDGGDGDDRLKGAHNNDELRGGAGRDTLAGGPGTDLLRDMFGQNVVNGGPGSDACVASASSEIRGCESP
jgi:hypothetical protein